MQRTILKMWIQDLSKSMGSSLYVWRYFHSVVCVDSSVNVWSVGFIGSVAVDVVNSSSLVVGVIRSGSVVGDPVALVISIVDSAVDIPRTVV